VSRKLLFLDLFPELKRALERHQQNINSATNALDAGSTLPRYQTIREDIEALNQYSRDLHGAQALAHEIEEDEPWRLRRYTDKYVADGHGKAYEQRTLDDLIDQFGICYHTYHRVRVSAVSDELAESATRLLGLNERSDNFLAIRMLIHSWRLSQYSPGGGDGKETETQFLRRYEFGFRYRRADYVRGRIDVPMYELGRGAEGEAGITKILRAALPSSAVPLGGGAVDGHAGGKFGRVAAAAQRGGIGEMEAFV
jgi:hypothetical protein